MMQQIYPSVRHDYRYELNKDFHFAAAHYIPAESAGQCSQLHGHTYFANITIGGDELDETGFLANFSEIKKLIHDRFDHTSLNEHAGLFGGNEPEQYPTTENVARRMAEIIQAYLDSKDNKAECLQIFLRETPTSYVIYRPKAGRL